ncbi:MAG: Rpn family recombination-promoting nuclease/putative transposase, partial [Bacteroidales bacterium]|nr:Rpn family recombination-promoting nuclease/putative transposase [Bacteroidales bacterium]
MKQKAIKPSGTQSTSKFQNLLTDFGFKFMFKQERFLISFLNELLQGEEKITRIKQLNTEQLGKTEKDKRVIFDIFCENERGEKILLEMQNLYQKHFLDRSIYYSSHLIQQQAVKGEKDFHLNAMYVIGVLNFIPAEMKDDVSPICRSQLVNIETGNVIFKKLNFIYVSLPKFEKDVSECKTLMDRWLYTLIHS